MRPRFWRRAPRLHDDPLPAVHDELAFHLEERTEALMAKGMSEPAARAEALRQFGDIATAAATIADIDSKRLRRARWSERMLSVVRDFNFAVRTMRRAPGFTFAAVVTIALGIGANTAVFSLLHQLLLQPLDAARPEELVRVYTSESHGVRTERDRFGGSSYADYMDLARSDALAGLAAYTPLAAYVELNDAAARFEARIVSENYFDVLDRRLLRGGWRADDATSASSDVVISHDFWTTSLRRDPSALGRTLVVNGTELRIAGITAPDFHGIEPSDVALYLPFGAAVRAAGRAEMLTDRGERYVRLLGRLAPKHTPQSAEQALSGIMSGLGAEFPASNANRVVSVRAATSIVPLELMGRAVVPTAALVFGATLVMLAISGVNIAAVLLARTIRRRRELAVRRSLGASRLRLVRQLVTESIALALAAGVVVIALVSLLPAFAGAIGVPRAVQPGIDPTVLAYAVAVALGFGILFGLAPAIAGMRSAVVESLRGGSASVRPARARAQRLLVGCQIALSMLLLLVSGALLGSLDRQQRVDPGFDTDNLIVAQFEGPPTGDGAARERAFAQLVAERLSALPGVTSFSLALMAPLTGEGARSTIHIPGYTPAVDEVMDVKMITAGPDFFRTLRIPLVRGREHTQTDRDTLARVVVNQAMAKKYWGRRDPVGTLVRLGGGDGTPAEVIGVAGDTRFYSLTEAPQPMYVIQRGTVGGPTLLIRASTDASPTLLAVRGALSRNNVPLTLTRLGTMQDVLRNSLTATRAVTATLMTIGILGVILAAVGLYGVVSHVMAGRTRELGVRIALGASPSSIARLVLGYGLRLAAVGAIAGIILGAAALRLLRSMLFGSWTSLPTGAIVTFVLSVVMLLASLVPALRATSTSPINALRSD